MSETIMNDNESKVISREAPDVPQDRAAYVKDILERIEFAVDFWKPAFDRMRMCQRFARDNRLFNESTPAADSYRVNITLQSLQRRAAALYAKNPRVYIKPRAKQMFRYWDGTLQSFQAAVQRYATGMPQAGDAELMAEIAEAKTHHTMLQRLARTVQLTYEHQIEEPRPRFKSQLKQAVRRTLTNGVAYCELGYQRQWDYPSHLDAEVQDHTARIAELERMLADAADGKIEAMQAEMGEMKAKLEAMQKAQILIRDGLSFSFPRSTEILIDPECTQLREFVGARWVAKRRLYSPERIREIWKVDIGSTFKRYDGAGAVTRKRKDTFAAVTFYYDLVGRVYSVVCDGYPDFLQVPGPAPVELEQFHPFLVLTFDDIEDESETGIYPPSHVERIMSINIEINRSRQALREHRISNRPAYLGVNGALGEKDLQKLSTHEVGEYIPLSVPATAKIGDVLASKPVTPINQEVYETESAHQDALRSVGDQDANIGPASGATATESSIAENSRLSGIESNKDDLDTFLTDIGQCAMQILLKEMDESTVREIVGPGAVWPQYTTDQIWRELDLTLVAGSSGRPNRGVQVAAAQQLTPLLIQVPGIQPMPLAKHLVALLDDGIDLEEWVLEGLPSIMSLNQQTQVGTGEPGSDPNLQGGRGGNKQPNPDSGDTAEGEPAMPAPGPGDVPMENQFA